MSYLAGRKERTTVRRKEHGYEANVDAGQTARLRVVANRAGLMTAKGLLVIAKSERVKAIQVFFAAQLLDRFACAGK